MTVEQLCPTAATQKIHDTPTVSHAGKEPSEDKAVGEAVGQEAPAIMADAHRPDSESGVSRTKATTSSQPRQDHIPGKGAAAEVCHVVPQATHVVPQATQVVPQATQVVPQTAQVVQASLPRTEADKTSQTEQGGARRTTIGNAIQLSDQASPAEQKVVKTKDKVVETAVSQREQTAGGAKKGVSQRESNGTLTEKPASQTGESVGRMEQKVVQLEHKTVRSEQKVRLVEERLTRMEQRVTQAEAKTNLVEARAEEAAKKAGQVEIKAGQLEVKIDEAGRAAKQAESHASQTASQASQAVSQANQALCQASQAASQASQAESRAAQAESMAKEAKAKTMQMSSSVSQATLHQKTPRSVSQVNPHQTPTTTMTTAQNAQGAIQANENTPSQTEHSNNTPSKEEDGTRRRKKAEWPILGYAPGGDEPGWHGLPDVNRNAACDYLKLLCRTLVRFGYPYRHLAGDLGQAAFAVGIFIRLTLTVGYQHDLVFYSLGWQHIGTAKVRVSRRINLAGLYDAYVVYNEAKSGRITVGEATESLWHTLGATDYDISVALDEVEAHRVTHKEGRKKMIQSEECNSHFARFLPRVLVSCSLQGLLAGAGYADYIACFVLNIAYGTYEYEKHAQTPQVGVVLATLTRVAKPAVRCDGLILSNVVALSMDHNLVTMCIELWSGSVSRMPGINDKMYDWLALSLFNSASKAVSSRLPWNTVALGPTAVWPGQPLLSSLCSATLCAVSLCFLNGAREGHWIILSVWALSSFAILASLGYVFCSQGT
jgi:hypothetical protein